MFARLHLRVQRAYHRFMAKPYIGWDPPRFERELQRRLESQESFQDLHESFIEQYGDRVDDDNVAPVDTAFRKAVKDETNRTLRKIQGDNAEDGAE